MLIYYLRKRNGEKSWPILTECLLYARHLLHTFDTQNFLNWQQLFLYFIGKETNAKGLAIFERQVLAAINTEQGFESPSVLFHTPMLCFNTTSKSIIIEAILMKILIKLYSSVTSRS